MSVTYLNSPLPEFNDAKSLLRFMLSEQQQAFGSTILDQFAYTIVLRALKLLLKEYSYQVVTRGIVIAIHHSDHPFSTSFIKDRILWRQDLENIAAVSKLRVYNPNKS